MGKIIVQIEHLSHRYSVQWAVRDICFNIPRKGIYGLLGSNGAGKSTIMNIICGVLKATEGTVLIQGIDTRKDPVEAKRLIGFLPQISHFLDIYRTSSWYIKLKSEFIFLGFRLERMSLYHTKRADSSTF